MKYIRIWLKGKRIGEPYDEYFLKDYLVFIGQGCVNLIPKKDAEHIKTMCLDFIKKVEVY